MQILKQSCDAILINKEFHHPSVMENKNTLMWEASQGWYNRQYFKKSNFFLTPISCFKTGTSSSLVVNYKDYWPRAYTAKTPE